MLGGSERRQQEEIQRTEVEMQRQKTRSDDVMDGGR